MYGVSEGFAVINAKTSTGTASCVVQVGGHAPIRFAYTSPNSAPKNSNVTFKAITDKGFDLIGIKNNESDKNYLIKEINDAVKDGLADTSTDDSVGFPINIDYNIWHQYVNGIFTKTICEAKNKNQLNKEPVIIFWNFP